MYLQFDDNRAREVFAVLQGLWKRQEGVFQGVVLPQQRVTLPEDPVKRANWLMFAAITQRGGIVSEDPFKYLVALAERYPTLMDPRGVLEHWSGPEHVQQALTAIVVDRVYREGDRREAELGEQLHLRGFAGGEERSGEGARKGLYKVDEFATSWWRNATTVATRWDGNILNAFDGVADFEAFFARADYKRNTLGLHGMRRKILSLLTIWLQELALVPVFPTPIPVDFHAMRLLFGTGVVAARDVLPLAINPAKHPSHLNGRPVVRVTEPLMDEIARWSQSFIANNGFDHLIINPALWVLSRELCPHEFQNQSKGRKQGMQVNWSDVLRKHPELWPVPYQDPVHHCPLAQWCRLTVAWGPYYDWGLLTLDERVDYPHPRLTMWEPPPKHQGRRKNARA